MGTSSRSACRKASGCAARDARRPSFASKSSRTWASAPSATTISPSRPRERIAQLLDADTFEEWFAGLQPLDPLGFNDRRPYPERVKAEQARTGLDEAAVVGQGFIKGIRIVFGITDSSFIMGSMGSVVGEKLTRAIEEATRQQLPLVIVSGSGGGARMHEGIFSLMQMAKVSTALGRYHAAGGLYLSVLTHPTMGGVAASFASLGDFILAEPKALIGFAGPRVIEQTVRVQLPSGFQTSEFLLRARLHRPDRPPPRPAKHDRAAHRLRHAVTAALPRLGSDRRRASRRLAPAVLPEQLQQQVVLGIGMAAILAERLGLSDADLGAAAGRPISPGSPGTRRCRAGAAASCAGWRGRRASARLVAKDARDIDVEIDRHRPARRGRRPRAGRRNRGAGSSRAAAPAPIAGWCSSGRAPRSRRRGPAGWSSRGRRCSRPAGP